MPATQDSVEELRIRVLGEYREMPTLSLTMQQACRLWGCDAAICCALVEHLVSEGALHWTRDGQLVRGATADRDVCHWKPRL
jgi:hypothetical protein